MSFYDWSYKIKASFESRFYIDSLSRENKQFVVDKYVSRRGIYKDTYLSSSGYTDYQLRPNLCIAMAVAPEIFIADHAIECIRIVESVLMSEKAMGIKTLDPSDKNYLGDYLNSDSSLGFNYHQGPEWLWPVGFLLRAKMNFGCTDPDEILRHLLAHQKHLGSEKWHSLPELTNSSGKFCADSCRAQAWSIATILDAVIDLQKLN